MQKDSEVQTSQQRLEERCKRLSLVPIEVPGAHFKETTVYVYKPPTPSEADIKARRAFYEQHKNDPHTLNT